MLSFVKMMAIVLNGDNGSYDRDVRSAIIGGNDEIVNNK